MTEASAQIPLLLAEDGILPVVVALVIGIVGTVARAFLPSRRADAEPQPAIVEPSPYASGR